MKHITYSLLITLSLSSVVMAMDVAVAASGGAGSSATVEETFESAAPMLRTAVERFAKRSALLKDDSPVPFLDLSLADKPAKLFGVHTELLPTLRMSDFKTTLLNHVGCSTRQYTQFVGDTTTQFTPKGTLAAREFMEPYVHAASMIGYGFTGYRKDEGTRLDGNSILSTLFEKDARLADKAVANIVGHNVVALEKWGCWVTRNVGTYVVVYNDAGMGDGFTKFGSDVPASDGIFSKEDNDLLIMTEGGPQSFLQACNALRSGVAIKALFGLRMPENLKFFSATEFFHLVQEALKLNKDLLPTDVKGILSKYLETHEAWNPTARDADTKEAMFYASAKAFWEEGLYVNLLEQVEIQKLA